VTGEVWALAAGSESEAERRPARTARQRIAAFGSVSAIGVGVQLAAIALLSALGWHHAAATAVGVGAAVLHNFAWHRAWTWNDRSPRGDRVLPALARFAAGNGLVSLIGNLALMHAFVGLAGLPVVLANLLAIALCGLVNFGIADRLVFVDVSRPKGPDAPGRARPDRLRRCYD
jgi:putative flippase GtrA